MKTVRQIIALGVAAASLVACSENDYRVYDTSQKDSVFFDYYNAKSQPDSAFVYNFDFNIAHEYLLEIPVTLMGFPVDHDRQIKIVTLSDSTDMVEGVHYEIAEAKIPAGEVKGAVKIRLLRDNDPELLAGSFKARFLIGESDDLKSVTNSFFKVTYSDIRPENRPSWWLTYQPMPVYSYENAQLFFEYFYRLCPAANIDMFNEMISTYGDYFVNATNVKGPFTMYTVFLRNNVCIPLKHDYPDMEFYDNPEW